MAPVALARERRARARPEAGRDNLQIRQRQQLIANREQLARRLAQRGLDEDHRPARRQQPVHPGAHAARARVDAFLQRLVDEQLAQQMRGDDEVEAPCPTSRQRGRQVRRHHARRGDPVDAHHLDVVAEPRAQRFGRGARPAPEIQRALRPRAVLGIHLRQDPGQRRARARRDVARVFAPQLGIGEIRRADQLARAHQALVNGRARRPADDPSCRATRAADAADPRWRRRRATRYPFPKMSLKLTTSRTPISSTKPAVCTAASIRGLTRLRVTDSRLMNTARMPSSAGSGNRLNNPR